SSFFLLTPPSLASDPFPYTTLFRSYGADGYDINLDPSTGNPSIPSYATLALSGQLDYGWGTTTDPRGLQLAGDPASRIAACWYSHRTNTRLDSIHVAITHPVPRYKK